MWKRTVAAFLIAGAWPALAVAEGIPGTVVSVAAMLKAAGYSDVAVGHRVLGGYVLQARLGDTFALVTIRPDGKTLETTELFRDGDGDGVFANDEALEPQGAAALDAQVRRALTQTAEDTDLDTLTAEETRAMAGFAQRSEPLFARASVKYTSEERLGSAVVTRRSEQTDNRTTRGGSSNSSFRATETTSFFSDNIRQFSALAIGSGGPIGTFAPLSPLAPVAPSVDADAIRASALSGAPDAEALRNSILATVPTADQIRATLGLTGQ